MTFKPLYAYMVLWILLLIGKDIIIINEKSIVAISFIAFVYFLQQNYADTLTEEVVDRIQRVIDRYKEFTFLVSRNLTETRNNLDKQRYAANISEELTKMVPLLMLHIKLKCMTDYASLITQNLKNKLDLCFAVGRTEITQTQRGISVGISTKIRNEWTVDEEQSRELLTNILSKI